VVVVEARDSIGGRVHTNTALGVPLDLGASWIHGVDGSPLSDIVEELGIETAPTDYENLIAYDEDGTPVSGESVIEAALVAGGILEGAGAAPNGSLQEVFAPALGELDAAERRLADFTLVS
jgi:phytoene dehydrogenase-like protein